jgi:hypothetical protein
VQRARTDAIWQLAVMAATDLVFVAGVLLPHLRTGVAEPVPALPTALEVAASVVVLALPAVACLVAFGSVSRWARRVASRRLEVLVLLTAAAGMAVYLSPWGIASTRTFLD